AWLSGCAGAVDVPAADREDSARQWTRAKGFDTFCPLGPWIETDAVSGDVALVTSVNGRVRHASIPRAGQGVAALIAAASSVMTLLPGDVLLAGGVGRAADELDRGDEVSVSIDGVGTLTNKVEKGD